MSYVGDYFISTTFHHRFTTVNGSGVPTTLGNTPSAQYYVDGGTTAFTAGLTLTADFNSVTGLNSLAVICTSSATGLTSGVNVSVQVAAGTVSGVSLVGYPIIEYSIMRRSALRAAVAGRTLAVAATGGAAIDWANVGNPGSTVDLSATTLFVVDTATAVTNDVGAIVTACNTIVPARLTAQGVTVQAVITSSTTILPARITAQGIDIGAIVTAVNTIVPARVTAQGIDVGAIVTTFNTIAAARVTVISASGLATLFLTDSGTTYASTTAGSVVSEIAVNAGGSALTEAGIADAVWNEAQADHTTAGTFGEIATETAAILVDTGTTLDGKIDTIDTNVDAILVDTAEIGTAGAGLTALSTQASMNTVTAHVTAIRAKVTALTYTVAGQVDANVQSINDVTITGDGSGTPFDV